MIKSRYIPTSNPAKKMENRINKQKVRIMLSREVINNIKNDADRNILNEILFDPANDIDWEKVYTFITTFKPDLLRYDGYQIRNMCEQPYIETREIKVPKAELDRIQALLTKEPKSEKDYMGEDETISYTAVFENGYEMDVKICGVKYMEGENNLPWTEAVLFRNGSEIGFTDPAAELGGWEIEDNGTIFRTIICEDIGSQTLTD